MTTWSSHILLLITVCVISRINSSGRSNRNIRMALEHAVKTEPNRMVGKTTSRIKIISSVQKYWYYISIGRVEFMLLNSGTGIETMDQTQTSQRKRQGAPQLDTSLTPLKLPKFRYNPIYDLQELAFPDTSDVIQGLWLFALETLFGPQGIWRWHIWVTHCDKMNVMRLQPRASNPSHVLHEQLHNTFIIPGRAGEGGGEMITVVLPPTIYVSPVSVVRAITVGAQHHERLYLKP